MKKIDAHIYFDQLKTRLGDLVELNKKNNFEFIVSPSPTETSEPNKSKIMYFFQSYLFSNIYFHKIAKRVSLLFYDSHYNLRVMWKVFTGFKDYKKISLPKNHLIYKKILKVNFLKMWLWLNPKKEMSMKDFYKFYEYKKIAGIKLHMYWHNLEIEYIEKIIKLNYLNKPIYIIMSYDSIEKLLVIVKKNKNTNFIFGYGGFPHYENFWKRFNCLKNVYIDIASLHVNKFHIRKIFQFFKIERIIFSTDYPYNFQKNHKFSYDLFERRLRNVPFNNLKENFFYKNISKLIM
jgi:hypothetical protein